MKPWESRLPKSPFRCSCGCELFVIELPTRGVSSQFGKVGESGFVVTDTDLDRLKYGKEPRTMKCTECRKRYPNPNLKT